MAIVRARTAQILSSVRAQAIRKGKETYGRYGLFMPINDVDASVDVNGNDCIPLPSSSIKHTHNFRVLAQSQQRTGNGLKWMERCRCRWLMVCECQYSVGDKQPSITRSLFDHNGNRVSFNQHSIKTA